MNKTRDNPSPCEGAPLASSTTNPTSEERTEVRIEEFDCESKLDSKYGEKLRSWNLGGPSGASWNWYSAALVCRARLSSSCLSQAEVKLRVGEKRIYRTGLKLQEYAPNFAAFEVASVDWEAELRGSEDEPFQTIPFVLSVEGKCELGATYFRTDGFSGGFSGGE